MQKKIGPIMLIAGTCMGSGMIALPMVLAKIGILPSIIFMFVMWGIMYWSSLVGIELNLQAGKSMTLGQLGKHFSGPTARNIGTLSLKALAYALLAAFMYGASSIIQRLIPSCSMSQILSMFAIGAFGLLTLPTKWLDYINRFLFGGLLIGIIGLIVMLAFSIQWLELPLYAPSYTTLSVWPMILPVVFTSFGFHTMIHTMTKYVGNHKETLKKSFFWGSLLPAIAYVIWTASVIGVIHHNNPTFYQEMMAGKAEVGDLVKELSQITAWPLMQGFIWCLLIAKLVVSVIGVGLSLRDSLNTLSKKEEGSLMNHVISPAVAILPSYMIALLIPNAFISVLGFAGMILALLAIILPLYLLSKVPQPLHYKELKSSFIIKLLWVTGLSVMGFEVFNMLHP